MNEDLIDELLESEAVRLAILRSRTNAFLATECPCES